MAIYKVQAPDGTVIKVEGPDGANEQEVLAQAQRLYAQQQQSSQVGGLYDGEPQQAGSSIVDGRLHLNGKPVGSLDLLKGAADTAATLGTGVAAQIAGGLSGAGNLMRTGNLEAAGQAYENSRDYINAIGWKPKTEVGMEVARELSVLGEVAAPVAQAIDDTVYTVSGENPYVAGTIKTAILSIPELFGLKGAVNGTAKAAAAARIIKPETRDALIAKNPFKDEGLAGMKLGQRTVNEFNYVTKLSNKMNEAKKQVEAMGIKLSNEDLKESILNAARDRAPERLKGQGMEVLQEELMEAQKLQREGVDDAFEVARSKLAHARVVPFQDLARTSWKEFVEDGYDMVQSPALRARLEDLAKLDERLPSTHDTPPVFQAKPVMRTRVTERGPLGEEIERDLTPEEVQAAQVPATDTKFSRVRLNEIEIIRRRINNDITGDGSKFKPFTAQDKALMKLRDKLDKTWESEFDNSAMSGDPDAQAAWKNARDLNRAYQKNFNANRTIQRFVAKDMDSEQLYRWLIGASAQGASKQAAATLRRMKEILGPNNEGIAKVRQAVLRDVFEPLFRDRPDFNGAIKYIDKLTQENPALLKELDVNLDELNTIRKAAHAARFTKDLGPWADKSWVTRTVSRLVFGHQIAKAGARMNIAHKIVDAIVGTGVLKERDILRHLVEVDYSRPVVEYRNPKFKEIMMYGLLSDAADHSNEEE